MGVVAEVYLVQWDRLVEQWSEQKSVKFWLRASENRPDWLEAYAPRLWQDSWRVAEAVGSIYQQTRTSLSPEQQHQMDGFYESLFAGDGTGCLCDLPGVKVSQRGAFAVALSPASVSRLRRLGRTLHFEELRTAVEAVLTPGSIVESFEEFADYWKQWSRLLERAYRKKLGVVVSLI